MYYRTNVHAEQAERYMSIAGSDGYDGLRTAFQHILVPLDGSTRAEQAFPLAARIAHFSNGTITLLCVVIPPLYVDALSPQPVLQQVMAEDIAAAKDYLTHVNAYGK